MSGGSHSQSEGNLEPASPAAQARADGPSAPRVPRINGLVVLLGIVLLGLCSGAFYLAWKRPQLERRRDEFVASAPTTAEGRLDMWLQVGGPQIHHRLSRVARFSPERPWLLTHRVADAAEAAAGTSELWGIECDALPQDFAHIEGLTVVVELPAPKALGSFALPADQERLVPLFDPQAPPFDPAERLVDLATYFLERMPQALARDIPGARIEFRVQSEAQPTDS